MKKAFRAIKYLLSPSAWGIRRAPTYSFEVDPEPSKPVYIAGMTTGWVYSTIQHKKEYFRVFRKNRERNLNEYSITFTIIQRTKELVWLLFWVMLISSVADYLIGKADLPNFLGSLSPTLLNHLTWPSEEEIKTILGIFIGAISAILGLIFAMYAVAFQISIEKYSSKVSEYINREVFGNFFFRLLVFTDLFSIALFLRLEILKLPSSFSFLVAVLLTATSLLGIILFKNNYAYAIKPENLFQRLFSDLLENINVASSKKKYSYRSWSIVKTAQIKTQDLLSLIQPLFEDLWEAKNWNDVIYAPTLLANLLVAYASKKKYIDKDRGWWFPLQQQQAKSNNSTLLPIKLNFEIQGKGPLFVPKANHDWFEDSISETLNAVEEKAIVRNKSHLLTHLIRAYQTILSGDYTKDENGRYQKTLKGLYEHQEMGSFEKYFERFLNLYEKIQTDEELGMYINAYFAIGLTLIDGFDYKNYQTVIRKLVGPNGTLPYKREQVAAVDLPAMFYAQALDYWDRLNLEVECEGRVVTPQSNLEKETLKAMCATEEKLFDKYFKMLADKQNAIFKDLGTKGRYKELGMMLKLRYEWFSRMLYVEKSDMAEKYSSELGASLYFLYMPREVVVEQEFWDQLQKIIFPAILEKRTGLFTQLATGIAMLMVNLNNSTDASADDRFFRNRLMIVVGGFLYLFCEFEQDHAYLVKYAQIIESIYRPDYFLRIMETLADNSIGGLSLTMKLIDWETTRYHNWFVEIIQKIDELPKTYDNVFAYAGLQQVADHPSKFIRELSHQYFNVEQDSIDGFVEWLKKRDAMRQLAALLSHRSATL